MSTASPWLDKWVVEKELGKGGQGTTFLVKAGDGDRVGVIKILKHQESDEARRRMYREVTNLKVLANAGCKVPGVLDSNTDQFESKEVALYFVMEYISGDSLAHVVTRTKGLSLEQAADVVLDLCVTIDKAAKEQVLHRDLKPENVVVRSTDPVDCVIVDYGLSFNQEDLDQLTQTGETLDNKFLSLPERRVPGGDRRDPRSDLTGVCGLLYYCITAQPPVDLADANGRPPHRRQGRSVREKLVGDPRTSELEAFFDRGFSTTIDTRYQTVNELVDRLKGVLSPAARRSTEDPVQFAQRSAEVILRHDRKTQLAKYKENSQGLVRTLRGVLSKYQQNKLFLYGVSAVGCPGFKWACPDDMQRLGVDFGARVAIQHNPQTVVITYHVYVRGSQCGVYRCLLRSKRETKRPNGPRLTWEPIGAPECILWYEGLRSPDLGVVEEDFRACLIEAMQIIERELVQ
jgi:serine/threonine protein kinase